MTKDRLQVLDVDVSVKAPKCPQSHLQHHENYSIAVCYQTRVVAIANGRFVDLYGISGNKLHPFTFIHQIAISEHTTRIYGTKIPTCKITEDNIHLNTVVATCVGFPVPAFLLIGAFMEFDISESDGTVTTRNATVLLGFRLYGSVSSHSVSVNNDEKVSKASAPVQVYFSFMEPIVECSVRKIVCFQNLRRAMTPDCGSVIILFMDSTIFGVFTWKERFSHREICLSRIKDRLEKIVIATCRPDGRFLIVGDMGGKLSVIDFQAFPPARHHTLSNIEQKLNGKRLELVSCSRFGVISRDNALEHVRLVHTLATSCTNCSYTRLYWWICDDCSQQTQFILAGKQDGSLNILKLVHLNSDTNSIVELKMIQIYPGLASGIQDAIRSISEPRLVAGSRSLHEFWVEFCVISETCWRIWRIKVEANRKEKRGQKIIDWPSVKDSLDFPVYTTQSMAIRGIVMLRSNSDLSRFIATVLLGSIPKHSVRLPISLIVANNQLQVLGLVTKALDQDVEFKLSSEFYSDTIKYQKSDVNNESNDHEENQEDSSGNYEHQSEPKSNRLTIQEKYKLPPMEWRIKCATPQTIQLDASQRQADIAPSTARMSKLRREDYNERVMSITHRVENLSGVMKSMRMSFQLFSSDVQLHMNFVSEQLEEVHRRQESAPLN